ncbi:Hypothetical predicted protein [Podarcis lilfordi]|uniref:Uncharacterized protein n=1 Tax=Podarcis lilfordi TaxID=74358 RepID=A0AA35PJV1_9SAUR|nr:Hypothetical predicted protein [Podarcis lilfordi]
MVAPNSLRSRVICKTKIVLMQRRRKSQNGLKLHHLAAVRILNQPKHQEIILCHPAFLLLRWPAVTRIFVNRPTA